MHFPMHLYHKPHVFNFGLYFPLDPFHPIVLFFGNKFDIFIPILNFLYFLSYVLELSIVVFENFGAILQIHTFLHLRFNFMFKTCNAIKHNSATVFVEGQKSVAYWV